MAKSSEVTYVSASHSRPILIIGAPRSGTTLLTTMLDAHPHIFMANESKIFVRILPHMNKYPSPVNKQTANKIIKRLKTQELHYINSLPTATEVLGAQGDMDLATFLRSLFELLAEKEGKRRWGEKTAVSYRQLDLICKTYPDALLLAMERSPFEIAASYEKINPKWGSLGGIIHWLDFKQSLARKAPPTPRILIVSYENLITNPKSTLEDVCDHIGEKFDPVMLDFHKTKRAISLAQDKFYEGTAKPLYHLTNQSAHLSNGLQKLIVKQLVSSVGTIERRPTLLYLLIKAWVNLRALLWEINNKLLKI